MQRWVGGTPCIPLRTLRSPRASPWPGVLEPQSHRIPVQRRGRWDRVTGGWMCRLAPSVPGMWHQLPGEGLGDELASAM